YAWQAQAYLLLSHFRPVEENWPRAKESAGRALLADPNLAEGHAALGSGLLFSEQHCQHAHRAPQIALDLGPKNSNARVLYGYSLAATGKLNQALAEIEQAVRDAPRDLMANAALARAYLWSRRLQDALAQSHETLEISPTLLHAHASLGLACAHL